MPFPAFFETVPSITLYDPLAALLGAGDGVITIGYADAVRLAGHSCPTVAGAWLMTAAALPLLYPDEMPQRGGVQVEMRDQEHEGVSGVMASVAQLITGAAGLGGFKGLAGRHARCLLLRFGAGGSAEMRFTRRDNGQAIACRFDTRSVPPDARMGDLLQAILAGRADAEATALFGSLWQDRVRRILATPETVVMAERLGRAA